MTGMRVRDLAGIPGFSGVRLDSLAARAVRTVSTDSRTLPRGAVFVALRGPHHDGHAHVDAAFDAGALLAIVETHWWRRHRGAHPDRPFGLVPDTTRAYGDLARLYRDRFAIPVLLVTGSNGKTGTKDMVAAALGTRYRVLATAGNLNNHIGLPATLLRLSPRHEVAVLEAGTNRPGDIPYLCGVARQTHAIVTNVGRAHIERLRSRTGIAAEKGAAFRTLPRDGVAIVNADEPLLRPHLRRGLRRVSFGASRRADVRVLAVDLDRDARPRCTVAAPAYAAQPLHLRLRGRGRHRAFNAAAALASGFALDCDASAMTDALERLPAEAGRLTVARFGGITVLDDTYNANPDSVLAALDALDGMRAPGAKVVVLGDMLELGRNARHEHRVIGERIAALGIPYLLTYGRLSRDVVAGARQPASFAQHFTDPRILQASLGALLEPGDVVLVKGSRGMRMEEIVAALRRRFAAGEAA